MREPSMTARDLVFLAGDYPWILLIYFVGLPLSAYIIGKLHGKGKGGSSPWKQFYSLIIYLCAVPGVFSAVLTASTVLNRRETLLDADLMVYFLPIVSMVITLVLVRKNVSFQAIPGFDRLSGLLILIAVTFIIVVTLDRTRIWLLFGGSIYTFLGFVLGLFALLRLGIYSLFRRKDEVKIKEPQLRLQ
jgi:hypothetical protein